MAAATPGDGSGPGEGAPGPTATTGADLLEDGAALLAGAGVEGARREAALLLAHLTGAPALALRAGVGRVDEASLRAPFLALVRRRASREPLQRILGSTGFHEVELGTPPGVFVPRPETEVLVETVLAELDRRADLGAPRILDLGTGTGAIAIALCAARPAATAVAVDLSPAALACTRRNAAAAGVAGRLRAMRGDLASALAPPRGERAAAFTAVVSNPPYVRRDELAGLAPEVRLHDPALALDGGPDGLDVIRRLAADVVRVTHPRGVLAMEIGASQADEVRRILVAEGWRDPCVRPDLAGRDRVVVAAPPAGDA